MTSGWPRSSTVASSSAARFPRRPRERLLAAACESRPQPARDDKALAGWNGLALAALAEAGFRLERGDYLDAARRLAEFLLGPLSDPDGRLLRTYRDSVGADPRLPGGLRERRRRAPRAALGHRRASLAGGSTSAGGPRGRALRRSGQRRLLRRRPRRGRARRTPQGVRRPPLAVRKLDARVRPPAPRTHLRRRRARAPRRRHLPRGAAGLERAPTAAGHLLCALQLHFSPPREMAVVGDSEDLRRAALEGFRPHTVYAFAPKPTDAVPLLAGRGRSRVNPPPTSASISPAARPSRRRRTSGRRSRPELF